MHGLNAAKRLLSSFEWLITVQQVANWPACIEHNSVTERNCTINYKQQWQQHNQRTADDININQFCVLQRGRKSARTVAKKVSQNTIVHIPFMWTPNAPHLWQNKPHLDVIIIHRARPDTVMHQTLSGTTRNETGIKTGWLTNVAVFQLANLGELQIQMLWKQHLWLQIVQICGLHT